MPAFAFDARREAAAVMFDDVPRNAEVRVVKKKKRESTERIFEAVWDGRAGVQQSQYRLYRTAGLCAAPLKVRERERELK